MSRTKGNPNKEMRDEKGKRKMKAGLESMKKERENIIQKPLLKKKRPKPREKKRKYQNL